MAECESKAQAISAFMKYRPQVVFLDIKLGPDNGLDILEDLSNYQFEIIVISGHQDYVRGVVRSNAIDFLYKPYKDEELIIAVDLLSQKLEHTFPKVNKVIVPLLSGGRRFIALSEIVYCKAENDATAIYLKDRKKVTTFQALSAFTHQLPVAKFFQVHKQYTVNLEYVEMCKTENGNHILKVAECNEEVKLARRRKRLFFNRYHG